MIETGASNCCCQWLMSLPISHTWFLSTVCKMASISPCRATMSHNTFRTVLRKTLIYPVWFINSNWSKHFGQGHWIIWAEPTTGPSLWLGKIEIAPANCIGWTSEKKGGKCISIGKCRKNCWMKEHKGGPVYQVSHHSLSMHHFTFSPWGLDSCFIPQQ